MSLWEDMDGQGRSLAGRVRGLAAFGGQARLWPASRAAAWIPSPLHPTMDYDISQQQL
jgi:hypothetical protein